MAFENTLPVPVPLGSGEVFTSPTLPSFLSAATGGNTTGQTGVPQGRPEAGPSSSFGAGVPSISSTPGALPDFITGAGTGQGETGGGPGRGGGGPGGPGGGLNSGRAGPGPGGTVNAPGLGQIGSAILGAGLSAVGAPPGVGALIDTGVQTAQASQDLSAINAKGLTPGQVLGGFFDTVTFGLTSFLGLTDSISAAATQNAQAAIATSSDAFNKSLGANVAAGVEAAGLGGFGPGGAVGANPGGTPGLGTGDAPGGAPGGTSTGIGTGTGQGSSETGVGTGGSGPGGPGVGSGSDSSGGSDDGSGGFT